MATGAISGADASRGFCDAADFDVEAELVGRQPIGGVVLAEVAALSRVDQALVQGFQYVNLHVAQAEARRLPGDATDQVSSIGGSEGADEANTLRAPLPGPPADGAD